MAKITFALQYGETVVVPLTEHLTIGSGDDNDVAVNDAHLSTYHAEIKQGADGRFELRDLDSTAGTFVNDQRVHSHWLSQGDRLRFGPLSAVFDLEASAAQGPEATQREWLAAIQALTTQHEEKTTALAKLNAAATAAQQEITAITAQQQQETARLEQIHRDSAQAEARLADLRQQLADFEQRHQEGLARDTARQDQVSAAEQGIDQLSQRRTEIEARLQELTGTEEKLAQALHRTQEAESQHATLSAAITTLSLDQQRREESLSHLQANFNSCESLLIARRSDIAVETQRLEEIKRRRADLETQCQELATTEQMLHRAREQLAALQKQLADMQSTAPQRALPATPVSVPIPHTTRIVAIGSPRSNLIPMKSERILKKNPDTPPR